MAPFFPDIVRRVERTLLLGTTIKLETMMMIMSMVMMRMKMKM